MGTRSIFFMHKNPRAVYKNLSRFVVGAIFGLSILLNGCTSLTRRMTGENVNAPSGKAANATSNQFGTPSNIAQSNKKVAVILGPGGYKSIAEVGVLKELIKAKIPIQAVAGVEWGALVGALYAQHGQINEAEWKLYKLSALHLGAVSFFTRRRETKSVGVIAHFLRQNLANEDVSKTSLPFMCPTLNLILGTVQIQTHGNLPEVVQNCLALPPIFNPRGSLMAAPLSLPDIVMDLRAQGYNVIILVNVLGDGDLFYHSRTVVNDSTIALWDEIRRQIFSVESMVTDVIDVDTQGISLDDFSARNRLLTAGEVAGDKAAGTLSNKYGF